MHTYITSKEELDALIRQAVEESVKNKLPEIISKAARKPIYTIEETCDLLGVSKRHLQYLRDTEQISYVQNGRKIYFRAEDLDQFCSENYFKTEGGCHE